MEFRTEYSKKDTFQNDEKCLFDLIDVFDASLPKGTKSNQNRKEMNTVSGINNISTERGTIDEMITEISLSEIHSFKNHPFKVVDDERMMDTAESIRAYGVLIPVIVRPRKEGGFEMISGHRRKRGSELAGLDRIPAIVRDLDDDAATIVMVDSNLQRETLLPSEKAFAYKMKLDAIKHQGLRTDLTSGQIVQKLKRSVDIVADQMGVNYKLVQRYIRLTEVITPILDMVDDKKIAFSTAVEISYLKKNEQIMLLDAIEYAQATPSLSQILRLKCLSQENGLTKEKITNIISEEKKSELDKIILTEEKIGKYFPPSYTPCERERIILKLLENWSQRWHQRVK